MLPKDAARYVINSVILLSSDLYQQNQKLKAENERLRELVGKLETPDRYPSHCFEMDCDNGWIEGDTDDIQDNPPHFCCDNCYEFGYCQDHKHRLIPHNGELWCEHCIADNQ